MFVMLDEDRVMRSDGSFEPVDAIVLATSTPSVGYLRELGALDDRDVRCTRGHLDDPLGLVFIGLEYSARMPRTP
jgi:hypothetical protein